MNKRVNNPFQPPDGIRRVKNEPGENGSVDRIIDNGLRKVFSDRRYGAATSGIQGMHCRIGVKDLDAFIPEHLRHG